MVLVLYDNEFKNHLVLRLLTLNPKLSYRNGVGLQMNTILPCNILMVNSY